MHEYNPCSWTVVATVIEKELKPSDQSVLRIQQHCAIISFISQRNPLHLLTEYILVPKMFSELFQSKNALSFLLYFFITKGSTALWCSLFVMCFPLLTWSLVCIFLSVCIIICEFRSVDWCCHLILVRRLWNTVAPLWIHVIFQKTDNIWIQFNFV